jgi:hypothetical protein
MEHTLATAGMRIATSHGRFDVGPLILLFATMAAIRFLFGITMTGPVIGTGILVGVALGFAVTVWGVVTPSAIALLVASLAAGPVRRHQARGATGS